MEQIDEIKLEYPQLAVCHSCLSADRKLSSLGEFHEIYLKLCDIGSFQNSNLDLLICWECLAVLRRVKLFIEKAQKAQELLNYSFYEKLEPQQCLSTLEHKSLYSIDTTDSPYTLLQESDKQEIFLKTEIDSNTERLSFNIDEPKNSTKRKIKNKKVTAKRKRLKKPQTIDKGEQNYVEIAINTETIKQEINVKQFVNNTVKGIGSQLTIDKKEQGVEFNSDDDWVPEDLGTDIPKEDIQKEVKKKDRGQKKRLRYKWIITHLPKIISEEIPITDQNEMKAMWEKERNSEYFNRDKPKCVLCLRIFKSQEFRKIHMRCHAETKKAAFCCDICKTYTSWKTLKMHIQTHYKKLRCKICQFECLQWHHMLYHRATHNKYVQCLSCEATFTERRKFFEHDKVLHKQFVCDLCSRKYDNKTDLEKHIERHNTHCSKCNKSFKNRDSYIQHRLRQHSARVSKENSYCVICNKQYSDESKYIRHIKYSLAHRHERKDDTKKYVKKPAQCPVCAKWYKSGYAMRNHYGMTHSGVTPYRCEPCDRYFLNSTRLVNHRERKHENIPPEKNHLCTMCGRYFSNKTILMNHIRTHTGERPFHCQYCDAKFAQKVALSTHVKTIHLKIKRQL